jgi:hypothetical protein
MATVQIVKDNAEIVESNLGEKRTARAISHRPDIWGGGFRRSLTFTNPLLFSSIPGC